MELELVSFIGRIIGIMGAILVAYTALSVHRRVWKEHRIDDEVSQEMRKEQSYGLVGLSAMILGLMIEVAVYFY